MPRCKGRDHKRLKPRGSEYRCAVQCIARTPPSAPLYSERPPLIGSIQHFQRHPEVTRSGDELVVFDLAVEERDLENARPYAHTYCPRTSASTRLRSPGPATASSHSVNVILTRRAACMGMGGLLVSRPSLMNTTRRSETWHAEQQTCDAQCHGQRPSRPGPRSSGSTRRRTPYNASLDRLAPLLTERPAPLPRMIGPMTIRQLHTKNAGTTAALEKLIVGCAADHRRPARSGWRRRATRTYSLRLLGLLPMPLLSGKDFSDCNARSLGLLKAGGL